RVRELLVVLGDDAGAGAAGAVELDELDVEQRRDLRHRAVQLGGEAAADAAGPVRDLHCSSASSLAVSVSSCSGGVSASSAAGPPASAGSVSSGVSGAAVCTCAGGPGSGGGGEEALGLSPAG